MVCAFIRNFGLCMASSAAAWMVAGKAGSMPEERMTSPPFMSFRLYINVAEILVLLPTSAIIFSRFSCLKKMAVFDTVAVLAAAVGVKGVSPLQGCNCYSYYTLP